MSAGLAITISANRSPEEPWRLTRLIKFLAVIVMQDRIPIADIAAVHDHKGTLSIWWRCEPAQVVGGGGDWASIAWGSFGESTIEHYDMTGRRLWSWQDDDPADDAEGSEI